MVKPHHTNLILCLAVASVDLLVIVAIITRYSYFLTLIAVGWVLNRNLRGKGPDTLSFVVAFIVFAIAAIYPEYQSTALIAFGQLTEGLLYAAKKRAEIDPLVLPTVLSPSQYPDEIQKRRKRLEEIASIENKPNATWGTWLTEVERIKMQSKSRVEMELEELERAQNELSLDDDTMEPEEIPKVWSRPPFVDWLKYEKQLCLEISKAEDSSETKKNKRGDFHMNAAAKEFVPVSARSASERLRANVEKVLAAAPHGIRSAMAPSPEWVSWAIKLAEKYHERSTHVLEECREDWKENRHVINALKSETVQGYSGSIVYIHALNYSLQDSFSRCSLPLPPGMSLKDAIALRQGTRYEVQLWAWMCYQSCVFDILGLIKAFDGPSQLSESILPAIRPTFKRRPMTTQVILYLSLSQPTYIYQPYPYLDSSEANDYGLAWYTSSLFDKNHNTDSHSLQRKNTYTPEPSDPFRYPEGVQFYQLDGCDIKNKFDGMVVTLEGGRECWTEAIPDICLRADEGNLEAVKSIVKAAAAVSEYEKRRVVNYARTWLQWTFHKHRMPSCLELYGGTPLIYACLNGHHDVVEYLLEEGADPTLRGTNSAQLNVNARGAVHKLFRKVELGEFEPQDLFVMGNCSARCDTLLASVRPFWRPASYRSEECEGNERSHFNNKPSDLSSLRLALRSVPLIDDRPPKKTCCLCRRRKSKYCLSNNSFEELAIKCNQCMCTDKALEKKEGIS